MYFFCFASLSENKHGPGKHVLLLWPVGARGVCGLRFADLAKLFCELLILGGGVTTRNLK